MIRVDKNTVLKILVSVLLTFPVFFIINDKIQQFEGKIELVKRYTTVTRYLDLDNDGFTEGINISNIEKDQLYLELWGQKGLLGVSSQKANLLRNSLIIDDINKNSLIDYACLSIFHDTLFLIHNEISITNHQSHIQPLKNICITPLIVKDALPEILKTDLIDLDNDGFKEYIFTIAHGARHRAIYSYNFHRNEIHKTKNEFTFFTDFNKVTINNKNSLLYTSYANANIPKEYIKQALKKLSWDTLYPDKFYSDENAYMGFLNQNLVQVGKPILKFGFTAMIRANPFVFNNKLHFIELETYLNQPDSFQTIKLLDVNFNPIKSIKINLPLNTESFNKYNKSVFQKVTFNTSDHFILTGRNDSIFELSIKDSLHLKYLFSDSNIPEGTALKQMDLTNDSVPEIVFFGPSGLTIFYNQFKEKIFIPSPSKINASVNFDKTGYKEFHQGYLLKSDNGGLLVFTFEQNTLYQYKWLFIMLALVTFYLLLTFIIRINTRKLEHEKIRLEEIVDNRTKEISEKNKALQHSNHVIKEKQKEILDSINYANRIQKALFSGEELLAKTFKEYFILLKPKDIVSGDFYWVTKRDNLLYLAVCDSTGHGVPGAFMSLLNIGFINEAVNEKKIVEPHLIFNYVRERLIESISKEGQKDGFDGILFCLNIDNNEMTYAAANNAPILLSSDKYEELPKNRMPVGKGERNEPFTLHKLNWVKGNTIYFYTDGYADQFGGPKGKKFKYKALNELLLKHSTLPMKEQRIKLELEFENWKGDLEQIDDICIIGLKY